jgi:hypothetical protein
MLRDVRDSRLYWIPYDAFWVRNHRNCRKIPTPTGWHECAAAPKAAAAQPPWLSLKTTPSKPFRPVGK